MRRYIYIPTFILALFLSGCTAAQRAAIDYTIDSGQQAKDAEADILKAAVCAMSIGAYHRQLSDAEKQAMNVLCGGAQERPITMEALLLELGKMLGGFDAPE